MLFAREVLFQETVFSELVIELRALFIVASGLDPLQDDFLFFVVFNHFIFAAHHFFDFRFVKLSVKKVSRKEGRKDNLASNGQIFIQMISNIYTKKNKKP